MTSFIDIVMEARKKKSTAKKEPAQDEEEEEEVDDELPADDGEPEDLVDPEDDEQEVTDDLPEDDGEPEDMVEDDTVESETEETDELPPEDGEPEDLTAEGDEEGGDPAEGGEDLPPEDGEPEDLTAEGDEESTEGDDMSGDTDTSMDDTTDTEETEQDDPRSRRLLLEDFTVLYFKTKDFLSKLTTLDKSDVILNQVVTQIDKNLSRLRTILWDFIVYDFEKNDMVTNLYRYNAFVEIFKVNLDMLSKAKDFVIKTRDELAEQAKKKPRFQ